MKWYVGPTYHFNVVGHISPWGVFLSPVSSPGCLFCPWNHTLRLISGPLRGVFVARYFFYRRYICFLTGCSWHAWYKCLCEIKKSNNSVPAFLQRKTLKKKREGSFSTENVLARLWTSISEVVSWKWNWDFCSWSIKLLAALLCDLYLWVTPHPDTIPSNPIHPTFSSTSVDGLLWWWSDCWSLYYVMFFLSHVIAMSSTCYNPLLYGWFNTAFRWSWWWTWW